MGTQITSGKWVYRTLAVLAVVALLMVAAPGRWVFRTLAVLAVVALLVVDAPGVKAGEYHYGSTLYCYECHTMHSSQSHEYTGISGATPPYPAGPFAKLLRLEANELCLTCHNGPTASGPDVLGDHGNGYIRQAGALSQNDDGDDPKGHTLGETNPIHPPGLSTNESCSVCHATIFGAGEDPDPPLLLLKCVSCHDPHGYFDPDETYDVGGALISDATNNRAGSQYRNLRTTLGAAVEPGVPVKLGVSYAPGTNDTTADVYVRNSSKYAVSDVDFNEPNPGDSGMGRWCSGCHIDDIHANSKSGGDWLLHPTKAVNIGFEDDATHSDETIWAGMANRVKVMSPTGVWSGSLTDLTPSCMTCHKSHGNQNPFGLIYMSGTGAVTEEGDGGTYQDLCWQCHIQ